MRMTKIAAIGLSPIAVTGCATIRAHLEQTAETQDQGFRREWTAMAADPDRVADWYARWTPAIGWVCGGARNATTGVTNFMSCSGPRDYTVRGSIQSP
jgi:hypothetical protein